MFIHTRHGITQNCVYILTLAFFVRARLQGMQHASHHTALVRCCYQCCFDLRFSKQQPTHIPQHFSDDCFCVAVCLILTPISLPPTIAAAAAAYFTPPREASIDFPNNNNNSSSQTDSPSAPSSLRCILVFHHVFRLAVFPLLLTALFVVFVAGIFPPYGESIGLCPFIRAKLAHFTMQSKSRILSS